MMEQSRLDHSKMMASKLPEGIEFDATVTLGLGNGRSNHEPGTPIRSATDQEVYG